MKAVRKQGMLATLLFPFYCLSRCGVSSLTGRREHVERHPEPVRKSESLILSAYQGLSVEDEQADASFH